MTATPHPSTEGSIVKKGDKWYVVIDNGRDPKTGRRRRKWYSGFDSEGDADEARDAILDGSYIARTKKTVAQYLGLEWLPDQDHLRPSTIRSYKGNLKRHVFPHIGNLRIQQVQASNLNSMYSALRRPAGGRTAGLSATTVRYIHAILRKALKDAQRDNLIPKNPALLATPPPAVPRGKSRFSTWTADEVRSFLRSVEGDRLYAAWMVAASTGMRRGEVLGLRWRDINSDMTEAQISQAVVSDAGAVTVGPTKTDHSDRTIALDQRTASTLSRHRRRQLEERMALGAEWPDHDLVFTGLDGRAVRPDWFTRRFRALAEKAGLPRIRLHDLRHTWATLALRAGVDAIVVSERLGHSTIAVTLDLYTHVDTDTQARAAEQVSNLVWRPEKTVG